MRTMSLPECLGTVVVHRYDAVTCRGNTCPRDLPLEVWFSHHTSFMTCRTNDCPHCVFSAQVEHGYDNPTSSAFSQAVARLTSMHCVPKRPSRLAWTSRGFLRPSYDRPLRENARFDFSIWGFVDATC